MIDTLPHISQARTAVPAEDPVCAFYTQHPYPPPVENLDRAINEWQNASRHRAEFHLLWPNRPYRADLEILVAGCGTWQAAKYAVCRPDAHVTGIDVSTTSLDHTNRLKAKYGLRNLDLQQLPIEQVATLGRKFDLIVCTGVLHHLEDPDAGLRALASALRPDGAMSLMLYAPYGRAGVAMLQDYCHRLGITPSTREINDLADTVEALPPHHPLVALLRTAADLRHADALADALLNPREQAYSVPQLFDFFDRTGVTFERWLRQAPYLPLCGAIARTPHARRISALPERAQYAALELWRGTMAMHSVIASVRGGARLRPSIRFDDDRWRQFVPIRTASSIAVQERLPAGAAAVLLNRNHQFHDLILPVNGRDKALVDAIDGRRSIAEIVIAQREEDAWARARILFERLWSYDQVVFDASEAD